MVIHACHWASQPNLLILCNEKWTTPKWGQCGPNAIKLPEDIHIDDQDEYYTFRDEKVTCKECLDLIMTMNQKKS